MSTPSFYQAQNAARWDHNPVMRTLAEQAPDYRRQGGIKSAATDKKRVALLLIDVQRDFSHPEGTLYVGGRSGTGAVDDSRRISEFIYREIGQITSVIPTMDTHEAFQIFTPSFWLDDAGAPLLPHDVIDGQMQIIRGGQATGLRARPNPTITAEVLGASNYGWFQSQCEFYCAELARKGKYQLYIWPEHCVLGSVGHALVGVVQEARMFHSYVRGAQNQVQVKGGNPLTENYSILGPEVLDRFDGKGQIAQKNRSFIDVLLAYDHVIVAGQASSHCVKSSIDDFLAEIQAKDPALAKKVTLLRDCTSAVVVPGVVDFTDAATAAFDRYESSGMQVVSSTDSLASWLK